MSSYSIKSLEHYFKVYRKSVRKPKRFWGKIAEDNFTWYRKWDKVLEFDMDQAEFTWFKNAKLNITKNCIDRHLANKGDEVAIIFEPNDPEEPSRKYTYSQLYAEVSKMANVLREVGVGKGDRVYLLAHDSGIGLCRFGLCTHWSNPLRGVWRFLIPRAIQSHQRLLV